MKESAVTNWLHDEVSTFLANSSLVSLTASEADNHVGLAEQRDDDELIYPFVGLQKIASNSRSAGIGSGELHVDSFTYSGDVIDSITYRREVDFRVEVIPVTDDDAKLRDDLVDGMANWFARLQRQDYGNDTLPSDMDSVEVEESSPQGRPDSFVRGEGVPLEITYSRFITDSAPWATVTKVIQQVEGPEHEYTIE